MFRVILNANEEKEKKDGFPWIFNNEIHHFEGTIENGAICRVENSEHQFVCYGFCNLDSKIMIRILSLKEDEQLDRSFFKKRMERAIEHRRNMNLLSCCRLIFAEADFLPGLIVDQYGAYLSVQFLCLGMERLKDMIVSLLVELLNPKGIYERSDVAVRQKEGLEEVKGFLYGEFDPKVEVIEDDIRFMVDLENGQKTGYFLDQKLNRGMLQYYVRDKVVLDAFSNVGGFALHAAKYGAKYIDACDISARACEEIKYNASLNGFDQIHVKCVDVFDYLHQKEIMDFYDCIILDPPAFTKAKETVKKAYQGYREINRQAMKIIRSGGYLFTFSCSQNMTPELFLDMLREAARDSNRVIQFLDFRIQSPDHPALLMSREQLYLKCVVLRVL